MGRVLSHGAVVCALIVAAFGCKQPEGDYYGTTEFADATHFRYCNSGEPEYVDPAMATSTTGTPLARLMFAGLAEFGSDLAGTPVPSLASSWEVSEDQRTFTFHLREGITWSNGRPITAHDFVYHASRILFPGSLSRNTTPLEPVKNAAQYNAARLKVLIAAHPPFAKGDIVDIVGLDGTIAEDIGKLDVPNSNLRKASKDVFLRDIGKPEGDAYETVPAGDEITIVELGGANRDWAYVFWPTTNVGRYGWLPLADLDIAPNAKALLTVHSLPPERRLGVSLAPDASFKAQQATVPASKLLMLPDGLGLFAKDDKTFVVETFAPVPYLIGEIHSRQWRPTPRESVSRSPMQWTQPDKKLLVTSGPFTMTRWRIRDRLEFTKADNFWDKDLVKVDRFTAYSIDDQAASTNFYLLGGCDAMAANNIPYSYLPVLSGEKRGGRGYKDFSMPPYAGIYFLTINTEKLNNKHLRRALSYAIDREPFPKILHGHETPSEQYNPGQAISTLTDEQLKLCGVTRDTPGNASPLSKDLCYVAPRGLGYKEEEAKKELAIAREEMGDKFPATLDLKFNTGSEGHKIVAEYAQNEWKKKLGLDVTLSSMEWKTYLKETSAGEFDIARMGWIGDSYDPESQFLLLFRCGSPYNRARWCNDDFERLFKKAQQTTVPKERYELLRQAEEIVVDEAPVIPLYVYTQKLLNKPYVRDLPVNIGNSPPPSTRCGSTKTGSPRPPRRRRATKCCA